MDKALYPSFRILLVDDEPAWLDALALSLEWSGITNIVTCQDSREVMGIVESGDVELILLDLNMPNLGGEELLALIGERHPEIVTIVISGMNQVEGAVQCMKLGAYDYFVKTSEDERLVSGVVRAIRMLELKQENRQMSQCILHGELKHPEAFDAIITADSRMHAIFSYIEAVARSSEPLLITGESGVGKELFAQVAHRLSGCRGPLVAVNVAGLDDNAFSDTLFGHVRGAYTGADQARRGMIEEAADGTLFLDEIGDMSLPSQVKLLRLLQEGEYFPLGSDVPKRIRARVIVATHQDLTAKQAAGTFRRDLYYRFRTHQVHIPPLRERKGDLAPLLDHFLGEAARAFGKKKPTPPKELPQLLATHSFPGNVRELKAMVFDAVSTHRERVLSLESFYQALRATDGGTPPGLVGGPDQNPFACMERLPTFGSAIELLMDEALARSGGKQTIAARLLGMTPSGLNKRLKSLSK
ncbi:sigma-54-dependent transcriptional regulator [Geomonas propionica]|uniref:Sigma-54-dependent Fis family transcriptional regulator n=1 Tax=Geomonas propionica TaxID=2798582 RepID=A0ABS0YPH0_9BACT|nr:sigma-54 dependent transcriptional regulator [Geomonas propionica]MBJ6799810.1 sigma-54-dependent Fis family transcriptional regulator [Geomonas propionica]